MSFEASIIVAIFVVTSTLVALMAMLANRSRKAKADDMRQAASSRGWKFETTMEHRYRVYRWSGTTDGISWVAESLRHTGGGDNRRRRRKISRWHGNYSPGVSGAILAMGLPKGKEVLGTPLAAGDGVLAKMAQKAAGFMFDMAVDVYFGDVAGKEVDAGKLHRIDREQIPGFIVMAADKDEGERILAQGLQTALTTVTADQGSALSDLDRPWVLLRPHAVSLARMEEYRDANEIERFARAGVALARTFKFGRSIS